MKKLLLLLFVAVLGFGMTGCALPPELAGAGDAAAFAMMMGQMIGGNMAEEEGGSGVSAMSIAYDMEISTSSDTNGWFDIEISTADPDMAGMTEMKMRYFLDGSDTAFEGTFNEFILEVLPIEYGGKGKTITGYGFSVSGTDEEGSYTTTMDATLDGETITMTGDMSFTDAQTAETATIEFKSLTVSAAGAITGGTITGTFDVYAISLTYASDGSATGTISEAGTKIADISFNADGSEGTMVYQGVTYDIGTGEATQG